MKFSILKQNNWTILQTKIFRFSFVCIIAVAHCMSNAMQQQNLPREKCVICLEKLSKKEFHHVTLECKHTFHTECIWKWVTKKKECPLCRKASTIDLQKEHIMILTPDTIKDIMKTQNYIIDTFYQLPAQDVKKILLLAGGITYANENKQSENSMIYTNPIRRPQQSEHLQNRANVMAALRGTFILLICTSLISIYPKKFCDELFMHKIFMLFFSSCGLAFTFWHPESFE